MNVRNRKTVSTELSPNHTLNNLLVNFKVIRFSQLLIFLFIITLTQSACQYASSKISADLQNVVEQVGKQYVPDSRIDVFNINLTRKGRQIIVAGEVLNPNLPNILLDSLRHTEQNLTFVDSIWVLPDESVQDRSYGIVKISVANMRRDPKYQAELVSQTLLGTVVRILKEDGFFYYVQNWDKYLGWLSKSSLAAVDSLTAREWQNSAHVVSTANYGIVRAQAGTSDDFIVDLVPGARIKLLNRGYGSYKVETPDGRKGFVQKDLVVEAKELQNVRVTRERIISTSKKFLGVPYLWGGTSVKGFDCSGFVQTVFRLNNVQLPRDASQIVREGEEISFGENFGNLYPGDLLFFGSNPERITHCGIFLGDSKFIHSSGSVHINSLDPQHPLYNEYRHRTLRKSKRVL